MKVMRIGKCIDKSCRGWLVAITTRIDGEWINYALRENILSAIMWGVCSDCGREAEVQV